MSLSRRAAAIAALALAAPHVARAQPRRFRLGHNNTVTRSCMPARSASTRR